jgi:hypothetical protein
MGSVFGSRNANARNTENRIMVEKTKLLRDSDYNTIKVMCIGYFKEIPYL